MDQDIPEQGPSPENAPSAPESSPNPTKRYSPNKRIDAGIKRGPRKSRNGVRKRDPITGQSLAVIPKDLLPSTVLDRYLADEKTSEIALSYNISRSRLHQWLIEHAEEHWKKAQIARAVTALDKAKDGLEEADDPLELARAREQLRGAQWELERLYSRVFGNKINVNNEVTIKDEDRMLLADASSLLGMFREKVVSEQHAAALPSSLPVNLNKPDTQVID